MKNFYVKCYKDNRKCEVYQLNDRDDAILLGQILYNTGDYDRVRIYADDKQIASI